MQDRALDLEGGGGDAPLPGFEMKNTISFIGTAGVGYGTVTYYFRGTDEPYLDITVATGPVVPDGELCLLSKKPMYGSNPGRLPDIWPLRFPRGGPW